MKNRLLPLFALFVFGACDMLGGSDQLEFQMLIQELAAPPEGGLPAPFAVVQGGRIVLTGFITTDCLQNAPNGNVVQVSRTQIHVIITEQQVEAGCTPTERIFTYTAFIGPLSINTYLVNVVHHPLGAAAETVFTEHIAVD